MTGAVCRRACTLRSALAEIRRHAAERPLINAAVFGARERNAIVFQLDDGIRGLFAHVFDRILIASQSEP